MLKDTEKEEKTWNQVPETAKNVSVFFHFFRNYVTERERVLSRMELKLLLYEHIFEDSRLKLDRPPSFRIF